VDSPSAVDSRKQHPYISGEESVTAEVATYQRTWCGSVYQMEGDYG